MARLTARFEEALVYACRLHAGQRRKGREVPYIGHLLGVASLVLEHGGAEDEAIAALLHDAVEDQGGTATRQEIARRFGEQVATIVDGCTDADVMPKPPWRARKETFIARLASASPSVRLVVSADKLHNARAVLEDYRLIGEALWERFRGGRAGSLWYYRAIAEALAAVAPTLLTAELNRVVTELERLAAGGEAA